jgi:hypothetical protein
MKKMSGNLRQPQDLPVLDSSANIMKTLSRLRIEGIEIKTTEATPHQ